MQKMIMVDAVIGTGFDSMDLADEMTQKGLARFTGNQWNEDWEWNRAELEKKSLQELSDLYQYIKNYQPPALFNRGKIVSVDEFIRQTQEKFEEIFKR